MDALFGYTGFVGGSITSQHLFADRYNSKNAQESAGKSYDLVVCAAAPGKKWLANQQPEQDAAAIHSIRNHLSKLKAKRIVLISTIDVYDVLTGADEDFEIEPDALQPYGKHRLQLERTVAELFPSYHIIRLPALFGPGLQKNVVFDLINARMLDYTHPDSYFQFYNMNRIWQDIQTVIQNNIRLVLMATEPVRAGDIAEKSFGYSLIPRPEIRPVHYALTSKYAPLFGGANGYLFSKDRIMTELIEFMRKEPKTVA